MKKIFSLLLLLGVALYVAAVPVERIPRLLTLADGSQIIAMPCGDEYYSWFETADGQVIEESEAGYFISQRSLAQHQASVRAARSIMPRKIGSQATAALPAIGSPKIPVILVNFSDSVFHTKPTPTELCTYFDLFCNGTRDGIRYTEHGSYGAIRDYYSDQSQGQFTPEFDIIGIVTLPNPESYYGSNGSGKDSRFSQFCTDAITQAMNAYPDVDWTRFSNRGNDRVDMVFFVFAGCGEHNGGGATTIWPKWKAVSLNVNGVSFYSALCGSENRPTTKNGVVTSVRPDGIGVLCHEMNHALGLPDFYDVNGKAFGMDLWSIMDYGQYANNGYLPSSMTSYEREFMGWLKIDELTTSGWLTLDPLGKDGKAYKIVNDENPGEYYIIENRQAVGWDEGVCGFGHGLMVTHVDYNAGKWSGNTVNTDTKHQRMTIIAANNRYIGTSIKTASMNDIIETWRGNLYPFVYYKNGQEICNDSLTAYSTPAATVYTPAGFMNKDLHGIVENNDKSVSVYFGDDFTVGITAPASKPANPAPHVIYDLSGRRVLLPSKGIYVIDGRKVVIP